MTIGRCYTYLMLLAALLATACIKLQEKEIKLAPICPQCVGYLQDSVKAMPGIKYVEYSPKLQLLNVKYDTTSFSPRRLQRFLTQQGFIRSVRDSSYKIPTCCK